MEMQMLFFTITKSYQNTLEVISFTFCLALKIKIIITFVNISPKVIISAPKMMPLF